MFIPDSDNPQENMYATEAMETAMDYIWEEFILPNIDPSNEDQVKMLTVVGLALHSIAEKASNYEKQLEGKFDKKNPFSRN